jgi:hypothetical protein
MPFSIAGLVYVPCWVNIRMCLPSKICKVPYVMVRNICLYVWKRRADAFSVEVIKLVFCLVMVLVGKEKSCRPLESRQACRPAVYRSDLSAFQLPTGSRYLPEADMISFIKKNYLKKFRGTAGRTTTTDEPFRIRVSRAREY